MAGTAIGQVGMPPVSYPDPTICEYKFGKPFTSDQSTILQLLPCRNWNALANGPDKGYANGVLAQGMQLFVGGQIGWNAEQKFETHDFIGQMEQTLRNILTVVERAGGSAEDIVRLTWFVTDKKEYLARQREVGEVYRKILGRNFPAMTMVVVSALIEDEALIEIEATAVLEPT